MAAVQAIDPRYTITDVVLNATLDQSALAARSSRAPRSPRSGARYLPALIDRATEVGIDEWRGGVHPRASGPGVALGESRERKLFER